MSRVGSHYSSLSVLGVTRYPPGTDRMRTTALKTNRNPCGQLMVPLPHEQTCGTENNRKPSCRNVDG
ncbi:MAG TPA: hypothetical protein VKU01_31295 [Bryobacteraceae bacterium]|nr:hypothetical protein [Bryobacteraceae bacterium]